MQLRESTSITTARTADNLKAQPTLDFVKKDKVKAQDIRNIKTSSSGINMAICAQILNAFLDRQGGTSL